MTTHSSNTRHFSASAALVFLIMAAFVVIGLAWVGAREAHSAEIIPSVGFSRPVDSDTDETELSAGLALRAPLGTPFLLGEVQGSYRTESRFGDQLRLRMWPLTASLYAAPVQYLYVGGGVGMYNITFDFDQDVLALPSDRTEQEFGVHLGGGFRIPLTPGATVDLGARYVMLRDQDTTLIPTGSFDPDFWTMNVGLGFGF
jgi:opacity protein-like surface antigen